MRIILALLVFPVAWPQAAQDSLEKKVAALLERLRSEEIETRDAAMKGLVELGEPALEIIEKTAESATDPAFAAHVKAVVTRIWRALPRAMSKPGDRLKLRSRRLAVAGGGKAVEDAVHSALAWLARHQELDGGWSNDAIGGAAKFAADPCAGAGSLVNDDGITALSVLAFLGAGYSPAVKEEIADPSDPKKRYKPGEVARKGLDRLRLRQRKDGAVLGGSRPNYAHALATMAFCEAAAMTGAAEDKDAARKALEYLLGARNPGAAWRYTHRPGDNDTSITGWCVAALHAAAQGDLWKVEKPVQTSVIDWMDRVTTLADSKAGYNGLGTGKVFVPGKNENHFHHETMTAISILSRRLLRPEDEDAVKRDAGLKLLMRDRPDRNPDAFDGYYWFWGSMAVHRIDDAAGLNWMKWVDALNKALLPSQLVKGCSHGSWDPVLDRWGFEGGRIGVTALNALTLLTPAR